MRSHNGVPPVLVVTHLHELNLGLVGNALAEQGLTVTHCNLFTSRELPDVTTISGIVSLGGQMSVTNLSAFPFLVDELDLMRAALHARLPIFGLCLGAQLLALAADGSVSTMPRRYIGWTDLSLTPAAWEDILFRDCHGDTPVIKWHADAITVSPTCTALATTPSPGCAVFRAGPCAWGSQVHLETTPEIMFDWWLRDPVEHRALLDAGLDPRAFELQCRQSLPDQITAFRPVFSRFADYVVDHHRAGVA